MNRYHAVIFVLLIIMVVAVLAAANVFGIGDGLAGLGGGIAAAIIGGLAAFLTWGGANGGPSVGVVYVSLMVIGFIAGGLIMKGVNKLKNRGAATMPVYQNQPTTIPITPVQLQSAPTPQPIVKEKQPEEIVNEQSST